MEFDNKSDGDGSSVYEMEQENCSNSNSDNEQDEQEIQLGATGASISEEEKLLQNPSLLKLFNQLLDERIKQASKAGESSNSTLLTELTPKQGGKKQQLVNNEVGQVVKSPSDTTIYVPALSKRMEQVNLMNVGNKRKINEIPVETAIDTNVSNFVDAAR